MRNSISLNFKRRGFDKWLKNLTGYQWQFVSSCWSRSTHLKPSILWIHVLDCQCHRAMGTNCWNSSPLSPVKERKRMENKTSKQRQRLTEKDGGPDRQTENQSRRHAELIQVHKFMGSNAVLFLSHDRILQNLHYKLIIWRQIYLEISAPS